MKSKVFRTQYPVPCERCGQLIRKGEKCLVQMDAKLGAACFTPKGVRSVAAGEDAEPMCDNEELVRALKLCVLAIEDMRQTDDEVCRMELSRTALDLARSALKKAGER